MRKKWRSVSARTREYFLDVWTHSSKRSWFWRVTYDQALSYGIKALFCHPSHSFVWNRPLSCLNSSQWRWSWSSGQVIDQQHSLETQKTAADPWPFKRIPQLSFRIAQSSLFNTVLFLYESDVQWCLDPGHKFGWINLFLSLQWFCYCKNVLSYS